MDQALLETAMLRAAELVVTFEHDRPNGEEFYSAFPDGWDRSGIRQGTLESLSSRRSIWSMIRALSFP